MLHTLICACPLPRALPGGKNTLHIMLLFKTCSGVVVLLFVFFCFFTAQQVMFDVLAGCGFREAHYEYVSDLKH